MVENRWMLIANEWPRNMVQRSLRGHRLARIYKVIQ
jgi:hypothetical protein